MGERKVLNKYFPPDFDPSKVPRGKRVRSEEKQMKVRMMLPMSVRCNTCGNFMYKGTKFNTRMEDVKGEAYLGIKIFRFYYRCTNCSAEFCMKTDPKSADYIVEGGATRNYEPWRDKEQSEAEAIAQKEEEEKGNAMKALENRTLDSKREMDILTALDEMRSLKARHEAVDTETALAALRRAAAAKEEQGPVDLDAEDEEAVRQMLLQRAGFVKRLDSSSGEEEEEEDGAGGGGAGAGIISGEDKESGRLSKRSRKDVGNGRGVPLSVAAAAWEEEQDDDDNTGGEEELLEIEKKTQGGGADEEHKNKIDADNINKNGNGGNKGGVTAPSAAGEKGAAGAANKGGGDGAWAGPVPRSVPSFAARPAAVVVKRKPAVQQVAEEKQQQQVEEEKEDALLGLAGYGSSDSD